MDYAIYGRKLKKDHPSMFNGVSDADAARGWIDVRGVDEAYYQAALDEFGAPKAVVSDALPAKRASGIRVTNNFGDIILPDEPQLSQEPKVFGFIQDLINNHHVKRGWWASLIEPSRLEVTAILVQKAELLYRLQQVANASEAENLLRGEKIWSAQLDSLLKQQTTATQITDQMRLRLMSQIQTQLVQSAYKEGVTLEIYLEGRQADLRFKDHERRVKLETSESVREYSEKSKAISDLAELKTKQRNERRKQLTQLREHLVTLRNSQGKMDEWLRTQEMEDTAAEIELLRQELYGLERAAEETGTPSDGQDNGGGNPPSQSGQSSQTDVGTGDKSASGPDARHIQ